MTFEDIMQDGITKLINKMKIDLKKLFKKIAEFIINVFTDISDLLEEKAPQAVILTQYIKESIEKHDGSIEWLLEKLKSEKLDYLYDFAKDKLPLVISEMALIDGLATKETPKDEAWNAYSNYIASKIKESRVKDWVLLASKILGAIISRKAPESWLIIATQFAYEKVFGKK